MLFTDKSKVWAGLSRVLTTELKQLARQQRLAKTKEASKVKVTCNYMRMCQLIMRAYT